MEVVWNSVTNRLISALLRSLRPLTSSLSVVTHCSTAAYMLRPRTE
jgi:hypothetical protein